MGGCNAKDAVVKVAAILSLTVIAVDCIHYGIDHLILSSISAVIGGIAGYHFRNQRRSNGDRGGGRGE